MKQTSGASFTVDERVLSTIKVKNYKENSIIRVFTHYD